MSNPQQPELARSRKTPAQDQDAVAAVVDGQCLPGKGGPGGPIPAENQPGHHPAKEQDKPDLNAFAARLGVTEGAKADDTSGRQMPIGKRSTLVGAAGALAIVLALVLAVVMVGRRRAR